LERLIALLIDLGAHPQPETAHAYLVLVGAAAERQGPLLGERLRDAVPGLRLQVNCGGGSFKSQFKRADRSGATWALILGEDEVANGRLGIKPLRGEAAQETLSEAEAIARLRELVVA